MEMNNTTIAIPKTLSTLAIDAVLIGLAILTPTLSHLTALPLYRLNPMLLLLLAGMLLGENRYNSLLLAVALPFVSCLAVGMPTAAKALCMAAELTTVALLYSMLTSKIKNQQHPLLASWMGVVVAMLCGKGVYYLLKSLLIGGTLVETSPILQAVTVVGYGLLFAAITAGVCRLRDRRCGHDKC